MLNAGRQKLDAKQGEAEAALEAKLAKLRQQMSDTLAELGDEIQAPVAGYGHAAVVATGALGWRVQAFTLA